MSGNEFTRSEILTWINQTLLLNLTKVEQLGSGAVYCQIFDSIFGDVPLSKVKFDTVLEYEFISNFKVLQSIFNKHAVRKPIPIEKLIKCKFQDNYEFICWAKKYWDMHPPISDYDPIARRRTAGKTILPNSRSRSNSRIASPKGSCSPIGGGSSSNLSSSFSMPSSNLHKSVNGSSGARRPRSSTQPTNRPLSSTNTLKSSSDFHSNAIKPALKASSMMSHYESERVQDMQQELLNLNKERDFYYKKLTEIESQVQDTLDDPLRNDSKAVALASRIKDILYAVEDGFEVPKSESPVIPPQIEGNGFHTTKDDTF